MFELDEKGKPILKPKIYNPICDDEEMNSEAGSLTLKATNMLRVPGHNSSLRHVNTLESSIAENENFSNTINPNGQTTPMHIYPRRYKNLNLDDSTNFIGGLNSDQNRRSNELKPSG